MTKTLRNTTRNTTGNSSAGSNNRKGFFKSIILSICIFVGISGGAWGQTVASYSFSQSAGTYTAITGGSLYDGASYGQMDDGTISNIPIGFTFLYRGSNITAVSLSTNGFVRTGATYPVNTYTPISNAATSNEVIAAFGCDLMMNTATSASNIRYQTIGTSPNRVCVLQWTNFQRWNYAGDNLNFQIRLSETTNDINIVYNCSTTNTSSSSPQVGLRGASNTDYNNRFKNTANNWLSNTIAGTANNSGVNFVSGSVPASGTTFTWANPPPTITTQPSNSGESTCQNGTAFSTLSVAATGTSLSYQWQSSTTSGGTYTNIAGATSSTYPPPNATTGTLYYKCYISNSAGNVTSTATGAYVVNSLPTAVTVTGGAICSGGTITASNGSSGTIYWQGTTSGGTSTSLGSGTTSPAITAAGTYYARAQSSAGCWGTQGSAAVTITAIPSCIASGFSPANGNSSENANGVTISWTAVAGATGYDVYFNGTLVSTNQAAITYSTGALLVSTTYTWQVVPKNACGSANSCTTYSFTTASSSCTPPTISSTSSTNINCFGQSTGSITVNATGGTSGYEYSKDNGNSWQTPSNAFSSLAAGTYTILVKGGDACVSAATSVTLTQPIAALSATASGGGLGCAGATVSLSSSVSGGTSPYTYSWSNPSGLSSGTIAAPTATIGSFASHTLTVTDANACQTSTSAVSIGGGITKYWAGAGSGMTGGTAGTDFNTAANWSSTTGTKTAVSASPQSCDDAVITLTSAATITLSANATVNSLNFTTVFNAAGAILDIQTFNLTTIASYAINMATGGGISSSIEQRIGNGAILTIGGNASIGTGPVTAGFVDVRGSGLTTTTGSIVFKGNLTFGDGYGQLDNTSFIQNVYFDASSSQNITMAPNYACGLKANNVIIGLTNTPTVNLLISSAYRAFLLHGSAPQLKVNSNCTLNMNAIFISKSTTWPAGGTINLQANSTIKLSGTTGGQTGSNFPLNFTTYTFDPTSTTEYYGATQTVFATPAYGHLTLSTSGTKTAGAALTVVGNLLINSPATFAAGTSLTHNIGGNWTNNGTFSFTTNNTINFNTAGSKTISGSSATAFNNITINKGTNVTNVMEANGVGALSNTGNITMTNGLFKMTTGTWQFNTSNPTIPTTAGIWINGAILNIGAYSITNNGWVRVSSGTATFGTGSGNGIANQTTGYFDVSGGTVNIGGRLENTANGTANAGVPGTGVDITGGTITVCTNANTSASLASFNMSATSNLSMTAGTVIVQTPNTNATPFNDINILSGGTKSISGGTFQIGNASTAASKTFLINSAININNLTINSTNAPVLRLVTSNLSLGTSGVLTMNGGNINARTAGLSVIVSKSDVAAVSRTAGFVDGNLQRAVNTTSAYLWPVGFSTNYTPASLSNLATGNLTVLANLVDQGNYATASLDIAKSVNTFWTLSGTSSPAYDGTLTYPSALNDDATVVASYQVGKYSAGWTYPSVSGTPTTTGISFTGANGLGDLIAAKCRTVTTSTAGPTQTICQTSTATLAGQAPGATAEVGTWSVTSGPSLLTTQFANVNAYNTIFTPAGGVGTYVLTWTINLPSPAACSNPSASSVTINVNATPTAAAGGTQTICQTGTATVSGASSSNGTILWTENGAGSITAGATTLTPTYTAAAGDGGNTVTLTMTVSNSPCTAATATYSVVVNAAPTATAGGTQTICETGTASVSGATSSNGTILWTSNGAGSITNATTLTPTYTAAAGDAGNTVTLTMTVTSNNACSPQTATATYSVVVNASPTAAAGGTQTICQTGTATVSGASSSNGTILWTENGAGSITAGATTLTPTYTAAAGDGGNTVTLTMTVSNSPCTAATATYSVVVNALPTITGTANVCMGSTTALTGSGTAASSNAWSSSNTGVGTINTTTTTGTLSPLATGTTNVTYTDNNGCVSAATTITVNALPTVTATASQSICPGSSVTLTGGGASSYSWNNGITNGVAFTPSATTTYTVTGTDANGCVNTANSTVTLYALPTWGNLQWPASGAICSTGTFDIYGQVYEGGVTNANFYAPGAGIVAQFGYSTSNSNPNTWSTWSTATYNVGVGNNDEFKGTFSGLSAGTYYYAFRYALNNGTCYVYGGYNVSGGGFWNGSSNTNGVLTVNAIPSISGTANVCMGSSTALTGSGTAASSNAWSSSNTGVGTINTTTTTGTLSPVAAGTTNVTYTDNNGCVSAATTVTVNALPTANAGADITGASTCGKNTTPLSASALSAGTTGLWSVVSGTGNTLFSLSGTAANCDFTGTYGQTYTLAWTVTASSCTATDNMVVTFNQPTTSSLSNIGTGDLLWNGLTDTDWSTATNWYAVSSAGLFERQTGSIEPTAAHQVFTLESATGGICIGSNMPTLGSGETALDVFITPGMTLNMGSGSLNLSGNLVNNGTINASQGTVSFVGAVNSTISGLGITTLNNVTVNKPSGYTVTLSKDVAVSGILNMLQGNVTTAASPNGLLTLGTSSTVPGTLTWTSGNIVGPFRRYFASSATSGNAGLFPVGTSAYQRYAKVDFTASPGTNQTLTAWYKTGALAMYNGLPLSIAGATVQNYSADGYWQIDPTANNYAAAINSANYSIVLYANNLSGMQDPTICRIIKSPGSNTSGSNHVVWQATGGTHTAIAAGTSASAFAITNTGVTGFSWFNVGSPNGQALPVELMNFSGNCADGQVNLEWQTASEHNSLYFEVEKSRDGENWQVLSTVPSAGNSTELLTYQAVDAHAGEGNNYYRLNQVDIDGASKLYDLINVSCSAGNKGYFSTYPNPTSGAFQVVLNDKDMLGAATLSIRDTKGASLLQRAIEVKLGINLFSVNDLHLAPGVYYIQVINGDQTTEVLKEVIR